LEITQVVGGIAGQVGQAALVGKAGAQRRLGLWLDGNRKAGGQGQDQDQR